MDSWERRLLLAAAIVLTVAAIYYLACKAWRWRRGAAFTIEQTSPRRSSLDGQEYRVHEGHLGSSEAADRLAELNGRVVALLRHLRAKYVRGSASVYHPARRAAVELLLARYNQDNLAENSPRDPTGDTAYSLNKGAIVAICLRDRTSPDSIHDIEILTFVTLHEMAHIAIVENTSNHPLNFWRVFRFLLDEAENAQIFVSPHYAENPVNYCGKLVDFSPRWDERLVPI